MNDDSFRKIFLEAEDKYKMNTASYNGFYFWNYIRCNVEEMYRKKIRGVSDAHFFYSESNINVIRALFKMIINHIRFGHVPKKQIDILVMAHPRRISDGKRFQCVYTDPIVEMYKNTLTLEMPYNYHHFIPARTQKIVYLDIIEIILQFYCKCANSFERKKTNKIINSFKSELSKIINQLNTDYKTYICVDSLASLCMFEYYRYVISKIILERIVKRTSPRVILEVVGYSKECMVLNEIALQNKIPSIELQHGAIGCEHSAYSYNPNQLERIAQFPRYIFLFSDFWKENVFFPIAKDRLISVGFPFLEEKRNSKPERFDTRKCVLFCSSGPIGEQLSKLACILSSNLEMDKYRIIYKLHPGEIYNWKNRYSHLKKCSDIEIVDNNDRDIYYWIHQSDYVISGYNSTTIYESVFFKKVVFVYKYSISGTVESLVSRCKNLFEFNNVYELESLLRNEYITESSDYLYKSNSKENIKELLDKLLMK